MNMRYEPEARETLRETVKAATRSMDEWLASSRDPSPNDRIAIRSWMNALRAALAATLAPDENVEQNVIHKHIVEYPSTCTGCEHLAASFVHNAPDWMLAGRSSSIVCLACSDE